MNKVVNKVFYVIVYISFVALCLQSGLYAKYVSFGNIMESSGAVAKFDVLFTPLDDDTNLVMDSFQGSSVSYGFDLKNDSEVDVNTTLVLTFDSSLDQNIKLRVVKNDSSLEIYPVSSYNLDRTIITFDLDDMEIGDELSYKLVIYNDSRLNITSMLDYNIRASVTFTQID